MPAPISSTADHVEIKAESIGFTLKSDEQTLRDIEEMQEKAINAAQNIKKFALR